MDMETMAESLSPLPQPGSSDQQQIASASILLQIVMLGVAFVLGHVLRRHKIYYINEASASLLLEKKLFLQQDFTRKFHHSFLLCIYGLFVGFIANVSNTEAHFRQWFNFHEEFFLLFLLPPIIFESGFSLQPKPFFSNFGAICIFAILGTFITSIVTGILVYLGGLFFLMYRLPFHESIMYGALISATDPVSVLAIFQELGTDVNLYALVFGESVLNDAVAISLYRTLLAVKNHPLETHGFMSAIWSFLEIFVGSLSSGVGVALICALLFKYSGLAVHGLQNLECCLVVLFPYFSYMLAEGLGLSGIVAILFCGILMKHYTFPNLSEGAQAFTSGFFQLISSLAETFVFIYMGMDIAIKSHSWSHVGFIFFSIVFIVIARAANVFPCARLVNMLRPASRQIPMNHQKALWFSGLRGAMAFALALQSVHDLKDNHGEIIFTATTAIVVLTVIVIGGSTSTMLEKLEVVGEAHGNDMILEGDEEEMEGLTTNSNNEDGDSDSTDPLTQKFQELRKSTASFTAIDKNFLKPFFTKEDKRRNSTDQAPNGKGEADFEKVSSQTQGKRGSTRQSTGIPSLNTDMECGVPDTPRPWRQNSANIVQNRSVSSREDETPVRHSSVPINLQPKDIRQQSNAARKEGKNRRPSF